MNKVTLVLLLIVALELPFFGARIYQKLTLQRPPIPNLDTLDSLTREELIEQAEGVRTVEDWSELAMYYLASGFFADAEVCYKQVTELSPSSPMAFFEYGFCLSRIGKLEEGNQQFEKAIELGYDDPAAAWYFIGRNQMRAENPEAAQKSFRKASELAIAKFELAKILFRKGELDESKRLLIEVLETNPDTMRLLPILARIEAAQGETRRAISFSVEGSEAIDRLSSPFDIEHKKIKTAYESIGYERRVLEILELANRLKTEEALTQFKALQEIRWTQSVNESIIKLEEDLLYRENALAHVQDRRRRLGPFSKWLEKEGELHRKMLNPEAAINAWKKSANLRTEIATASFEALAENSDREGNHQQSIDYQVAGINQIGRKYFQIGQYYDAAMALKEALKLNPESAVTHYNLGKANRRIQKFEEAEKHYRKCLEIDPTFGRAIRELQIVDID